MALCPHCYTPIPEGSKRIYCCTRCRREAQNERRRDERAEAREIREAERARPMGDPFDPDHIETLDWWEAAEIYANALPYPAPVMIETRYDQVQRAYRVLQDKELQRPQKMVQLWLM